MAGACSAKAPTSGSPLKPDTRVTTQSRPLMSSYYHAPMPTVTSLLSYLPTASQVRALAGVAIIDQEEQQPANGATDNATPRPKALPFRLSSSIPIIPAKLVTKIQSLQFVELKEFLPDNVELIKKLEAIDRAAFTGVPPSQRPKLRDIPNIAAWAYCFSQYLAVLAVSHPHLIKDRLAYMCLLISEARRNGGRGWSDYDTLFRQHAAVGDQDPTCPEARMDWSRLDASLHATYLVGGRDRDGRQCRLCGGVDHEADSCALKALMSHSRPESRPPSMAAPSTPLSHHKSRQKYLSGSSPICIQWNRGECTREVCRYRHTCATCPGEHRASECPKTEQDSFYKRAAGRRQHSNQ